MPARIIIWLFGLVVGLLIGFTSKEIYLLNIDKQRVQGLHDTYLKGSNSIDLNKAILSLQREVLRGNIIKHEVIFPNLKNTRNDMKDIGDFVERNRIDIVHSSAVATQQPITFTLELWAKPEFNKTLELFLYKYPDAIHDYQTGMPVNFY